VESPSTALPTGKFSTPRHSNRSTFIRRRGRRPRRRRRLLHLAPDPRPASLLRDESRVLGTRLLSRRNPFRHTSQHRLAGGYTIAELAEEELLRRTAAIIAEGKILGWYQGRAEWGPRALGNRSIVADPRRPK